MQTALIILAAAALVTVAAVLRVRLQFRMASNTHAQVQAAALTVEPLIVTASPVYPLLERPGNADGWMLATPDGVCAVISDGARRLLAVGRLSPPHRLATFLRGGEVVEARLLDELRERSVIASRRVQASAVPCRQIELAGVALRDRAGNLWGAALFIRSSPGVSGSTAESPR